MNSSFKLALGIIAAAALFALANSFFVVQITQHAIVQRFGEVTRQPISEPGLYFKVPFIENVVVVDKRILDLDLPVTPVATSVGLLWNRRDWRKKAGRAAIEFLPAIPTGLDKQTFMRTLEDTIETASDRLIAEFSGRPYMPSQLVLRSQGQTGIGMPITAPRATP